jgi:hypothetical protein
MTPVYEVSNGMTQVDVHDFAAVIGQDINQWDALVDNTDDIFCGFSYVDKTIATIINNHVGRADRVRIIGLDNNQRHKFYKGLSLEIHFTKDRQVPNLLPNQCDIIIHLTSTEHPLWTIPSYSEYNRLYCHPEVLDDSSAPENPRTFYHRIDLTPGSLTYSSQLRNVVTLEEYIRFEKLSRWYWAIRREHVNRLNRRRVTGHWLHPRNPAQIAYQASLRPPSQKNKNIRLELSDMIFDIKDKISDAEFKTIMDKMVEFVC